MDGNNGWKEYNEITTNISNIILLQDCSIYLTRNGEIKGMEIDYDGPLPNIIDIFGELMLLTFDHKLISFYLSGEYDHINVFELCNDFKNVGDVIKAIDVGNKRMCLTRKGEIYLSEFGQLIKLNIIAKNIFENSKYIVMII
jgi:hypothetical protein